MSETFVIKDIDNFKSLQWLDKYMIGHAGFIAGGCFKNIFKGEKVKDVDIFFESVIDFEKAVAWFRDDTENFVMHYENEKVIAFKDIKTGVSIECVRTVFGTPESIISDFDFTITKFAYFKQETTITTDDQLFGEPEEDTVTEWKVMCHKDYFEHLQMNRLVIDANIPFPANTFERVLRYTGYGYGLCRESKVKLLEEIRKISEDIDLSDSLYEGKD